MPVFLLFFCCCKSVLEGGVSRLIMVVGCVVCACVVGVFCEKEGFSSVSSVIMASSLTGSLPASS